MLIKMGQRECPFALFPGVFGIIAPEFFGQIVGHPVGLEGKLGDVFLDDEVGVCLDVCERNPVGKENLIVFQAQLVAGGICRLEQMTEQGFEVLFGQQVDGGCADQELLPENEDADF